MLIMNAVPVYGIYYQTEVVESIQIRQLLRMGQTCASHVFHFKGVHMFGCSFICRAWAGDSR